MSREETSTGFAWLTGPSRRLIGSPDADVVRLDVSDLDQCRSACNDIDTVIHLAAEPSPEADFYGAFWPTTLLGRTTCSRPQPRRGAGG